MKLQVRFAGHPDRPLVGTLAADARGRVFFEFHHDWPGYGFDLSPVHLPLGTGGSLTTPTPAFSPLFGLFDDSLPDWWGQRVMRHHFATLNIPWNQVTPLEKLACQGGFALGALAYEPDLSPKSFRETLSTEVASLVQSARQIFHGHPVDVLPALVRGGLSPGGAQPKALVAFDATFTSAVAGGATPPPGFDSWLIKFQLDPEDPLTREEHAVTTMAASADIQVPETRLYSASDGGVHLLSRRFDRRPEGPVHLHSYAGLTHTPPRDLIDYRDLMDLTRHLSSDETEVEEMFRRAVFNVGVANDDDHSRNHAFLMDATGRWTLAPAYDLTRGSYALGSGFRAAGVNGRFSRLSRPDLVALGKSQAVRRIDDQIDKVLAAIRRWPEFADAAGLSQSHAAQLHSEMPGAAW